jgi:FKBP-type peptidyl-prolyl cis-trans isomerase 2
MKKTHWRKLDNPNYLGAYSLMDGSDKDLIVQIEKVVTETVKSDRGDEACKVAYLKGHKPMILNSTNSQTIAKVLDSPFIEDWKGKKVTLFVAKIKAFGERMDALRVRPHKPKIELPELTPDHEKWEGAKKALAAGSVTIQAIKKNYKLSDKNKTKLLDETV